MSTGVGGAENMGLLDMGSTWLRFCFKLKKNLWSAVAKPVLIELAPH